MRRLLRAVVPALLVFCAAHAAAAPSEPAARRAITRALPILQRSAATFVSEHACVSCHHNVLPILTFRLAMERGFRVEAPVVDAVEARTFHELRAPSALDDAVQAVGLADPALNNSYLLMAAHAARVPPDLTTGVYARHMASWQRDGHWTTSDFRPPHSSSAFTATATVIQALRFYMPEALALERDVRVRRAVEWLSSTDPESTEDAAFRVLGLAWGGASRAQIEAAARDLTRLQRADGGWPQLPSYASDAYSTGEALYALREARVSAADPRWQRGQTFLLSTQARDGTWRVRTRMISPAEVSPPYFESGFPYRHDQFLSYAGTCWAVMGMLAGLPEAPAAPAPLQDGGGRAAQLPVWTRTVLFGSARDLAALIDSGWDPRSSTDGGTTALMMAAPDADKVKLLLARGVDVRARGRLKADALTIAAAHGGTSAAVQALLAAGANPEAPDGVRILRSPLVLASMAGEEATVRLLLARGATPSAEALSEAVTFDRADVARLLTQAGADARLTESSGVNLLHWAAITNRAALVPILVSAGVPLDVADEAGYTPLMYAATIDHGDTRALSALLAAGADTRVRNRAGRTPLAQARYLGHREHAAILVAAQRTAAPSPVRAAAPKTLR